MNDYGTQFDEYKQMLEMEYLRNVDAGMKNHAARGEAKNSVNKAYPDIAEAMRAAMRTDGNNPETAVARSMVASMTGFWARLEKIAYGRRSKADSDTPPTAPVVASRNGYQPTDDIEKYLTAIDPAIGEEVPLNLEFLAIKYDKPNDSPYRHPFTGKGSRLIKNGWRFEIINNKGREYRVKIIGKPAPPEPITVVPPPAPGPSERTYTAAEVQALFAEFLSSRKG